MHSSIRPLELIRDSKQHRKTSELVLHLASKLETKNDYSISFLYKALYFVDNVSFLVRDKPISDFTYIKQRNGPVPEPCMWLSVKRFLLNSGDFVIKARRLVATRGADLGYFSKEEIETINVVISSIDNSFSIRVSDHLQPCDYLQVAQNNEPLPFYLFLFTSGSYSEEDIEWAKAELRLNKR